MRNRLPAAAATTDVRVADSSTANPVLAVATRRVEARVIVARAAVAGIQGPRATGVPAAPRRRRIGSAGTRSAPPGTGLVSRAGRTTNPTAPDVTSPARTAVPVAAGRIRIAGVGMTRSRTAAPVAAGRIRTARVGMRDFLIGPRMLVAAVRRSEQGANGAARTPAALTPGDRPEIGIVPTGTVLMGIVPTVGPAGARVLPTRAGDSATTGRTSTVAGATTDPKRGTTRAAAMIAPAPTAMTAPTTVALPVAAPARRHPGRLLARRISGRSACVPAATAPIVNVLGTVSARRAPTVHAGTKTAAGAAVRLIATATTAGGPSRPVVGPAPRTGTGQLVPARGNSKATCRAGSSEPAAGNPGTAGTVADHVRTGIGRTVPLALATPTDHVRTATVRIVLPDGTPIDPSAVAATGPPRAAPTKAAAPRIRRADGSHAAGDRHAVSGRPGVPPSVVT